MLLGNAEVDAMMEVVTVVVDVTVAAVAGSSRRKVRVARNAPT